MVYASLILFLNLRWMELAVHGQIMILRQLSRFDLSLQLCSAAGGRNSWCELVLGIRVA